MELAIVRVVLTQKKKKREKKMVARSFFVFEVFIFFEENQVLIIHGIN